MQPAQPAAEWSSMRAGKARAHACGWQLDVCGLARQQQAQAQQRHHQQPLYEQRTPPCERHGHQAAKDVPAGGPGSVPGATQRQSRAQPVPRTPEHSPLGRRGRKRPASAPWRPWEPHHLQRQRGLLIPCPAKRLLQERCLCLLLHLGAPMNGAARATKEASPTPTMQRAASSV